MGKDEAEALGGYKITKGLEYHIRNWGLLLSSSTPCSLLSVIRVSATTYCSHLFMVIFPARQ